MSFAAFIMTYHRSSILAQTIEIILQQTIVPEKILIIDNSEDHFTEELITSLNNPKLGYYRVGYNAGPAGAAHLGLKLLADEGYDWIYWGDDDNPPRYLDDFERLFNITRTKQHHRIGIVGLFGNFFNKNNGKIDLIPVEKLNGAISVNSLAGGSTMLVHRDIILNGILPDESLFFGFEELDFCLKVKIAGYEILIDGDYYKQEKLKSKKIKSSSAQIPLWRQYYSLRNLLIITYHKENSLSGALHIISRNIIKYIIRFRPFSTYHTRLWICWVAIYHGLSNKKGFYIGSDYGR